MAPTGSGSHGRYLLSHRRDCSFDQTIFSFQSIWYKKAICVRGRKWQIQENERNGRMPKPSGMKLGENTEFKAEDNHAGVAWTKGPEAKG